MTKAELQKLDAGVKFGAQFQGEKIPTLQETLDLAKKRGLNVNMEIKPSGGRDVETATVAMNTLKQHWPDHKDKVLVSSFSREALATAKKVAPEIPRGFLMEEIDADWKDAAKKLGATSINCNQKDLNPPLVQEMKKEGYKVTAWTVNTPKRATELWNMKVDSIFTDAPGQMLMVQKKWAADKLKSSGLVATAAANASSKGVSR
jgi:glycerophosphoryl diester phosphodiesterase